MSADGKTIGTIKIENDAIRRPKAARSLTIASSVTASTKQAKPWHGRRHGRLPLYQSSRQSTTIAPPEVAKPEDPSPMRPSRTPSLRAQSRPRPLRLQPRKPRLPACSRQPATPRVRPSWQLSLREQPLSPQAPWRAVSALRRLCAHGSSREGPQPQHRLTTPPPSSPPAVAFSICVRRGCTRLSLV